MNPKKLARKVLPKQGMRLAEETYRKGRVYTLQALNGFPTRGLRVIGVTGTNGKTTTCNFINEILKEAGYKTAMYTTATIELGGQKRHNESHVTVPVTAELIGFFKAAAKSRVDFVVMEMTSQALDQHKLLDISPELAVMTNLSQEHLDYHGGMEKYAASKARLFNKYMNPASSVLNKDDEWYEYFAGQAAQKVISYGKDKESSIRIGAVKLAPTGSDFSLKIGGKELNVHTQLRGEFNVYNAAAAASAAVALGLDSKAIADGIAALTGVPGRMEKVEAGQDFEVLVDYAITPDALAKALQALRATVRGRVLVVFGSTGGGRDKAKRPVMGQVVAKNADLIFLTDDEPYTEDPNAIRRAVYEGIIKAGGKNKTTEIADRRQAITAAFGAARAGDGVLLAGIGHQNYRAIGGKKVPWDEAAVARQALKSK